MEFLKCKYLRFLNLCIKFFSMGSARMENRMPDFRFQGARPDEFPKLQVLEKHFHLKQIVSFSEVINEQLTDLCLPLADLNFNACYGDRPVKFITNLETLKRKFLDLKNVTGTLDIVGNDLVGFFSPITISSIFKDFLSFFKEGLNNLIPVMAVKFGSPMIKPDWCEQPRILVKFRSRISDDEFHVSHEPRML